MREVFSDDEDAERTSAGFTFLQTKEWSTDPTFFLFPKIGLSRKMWRLSLIYGPAHPVVETVSRGKVVEVRVLSKSEVFSVKKTQ